MALIVMALHRHLWLQAQHSTSRLVVFQFHMRCAVDNAILSIEIQILRCHAVISASIGTGQSTYWLLIITAMWVSNTRNTRVRYAYTTIRVYTSPRILCSSNVYRNNSLQATISKRQFCLSAYKIAMSCDISSSDRISPTFKDTFPLPPLGPLSQHRPIARRATSAQLSNTGKRIESQSCLQRYTAIMRYTSTLQALWAP